MYDHAAGHFHVQCVAEPLAVVPVHAQTVGREGDGSSGLRTHFHGDTVVFQREAVGQVFDGFHVGYSYGNFVAFVHFERRQAVRRRNCGHVHAYFVAFTDNVGRFFQFNAVFFGLVQSTLPHPWVFAVPGFFRIDFAGSHQHHIVWFGKGWVVVYQTHFFAGNVDQLVAFRFQRANVQETVFGELVQRHQPLAVRLFGFTHSGVVVAGLVAHVQFLYDVIAGFALAGIGIDGFLDVPFHHLAVQEQSGVGIAAAVECGVERAQT